MTKEKYPKILKKTKDISGKRRILVQIADDEAQFFKFSEDWEDEKIINIVKEHIKKVQEEKIKQDVTT